MSITHHMTLRARHGRSFRLGQCLAALQAIRASEPGCLAVNVRQSREEPLCWQVQSVWRSAAARDAFLAAEALRQVLAQAIGEDLLASFESAVEPLQQVA